ncbi:hypothetical protein [Streptomyces sp. NPDC014622]|uniref:hypothetical protein n=1 Tax=Streptomyces sp. NPDC014622 TaxID=3364874 RepID=UPI0036F6C299
MSTCRQASRWSACARTAFSTKQQKQRTPSLRLMRLFGITEKTAMHYVTAAHPERTAKLPR